MKKLFYVETNAADYIFSVNEDGARYIDDANFADELFEFSDPLERIDAVEDDSSWEEIEMEDLEDFLNNSSDVQILAEIETDKI